MELGNFDIRIRKSIDDGLREATAILTNSVESSAQKEELVIANAAMPLMSEMPLIPAVSVSSVLPSNQCKCTTKEGKKCKKAKVKGTDYCAIHKQCKNRFNTPKRSPNQLNGGRRTRKHH